MHEPIISPGVVYLMGILQPTTCLAVFLGVISLVVTSICLVESTMSSYEEDRQTKYRKNSKIALSFAIMFFTLSALIPSKETAIQMYIASKVTPHNIEVMGETADKAVDKLLDKILKLKDLSGGR